MDPSGWGKCYLSSGVPVTKTPQPKSAKEALGSQGPGALGEPNLDLNGRRIDFSTGSPRSATIGYCMAGVADQECVGSG